MHYQIVWNIEPGLRGLSCLDFRAVEIPQGAGPDNERGVAVEFGSQADADAFMAKLEKVFPPQRFSNNATPFETVKAFILEWAAQRK